MSDDQKSKPNTAVIIAIVTGVFALCTTITTVIAAPVILKMLENETPTPIVIVATPTFQIFPTDTQSVVIPLSETPQTPTDTLTPTVTPEIIIRNLIANVGGNYFADLASSWEISDDGTIWTFELKSGIQMEGGNPFTSSVVRDVLAIWQPVRVGAATVDIVDSDTVIMRFSLPPTDFQKFFNDLSVIEFKTLK